MESAMKKNEPFILLKISLQKESKRNIYTINSWKITVST